MLWVIIVPLLGHRCSKIRNNINILIKFHYHDLHFLEMLGHYHKRVRGTKLSNNLAFGNIYHISVMLVNIPLKLMESPCCQKIGLERSLFVGKFGIYTPQTSFCCLFTKLSQPTSHNLHSIATDLWPHQKTSSNCQKRLSFCNPKIWSS